MQTLNSVVTRDFLNRFGDFSDTVLRKIEISYSQGGERSISVWISTRDNEQSASDNWVCVHIVVSGVEDYCFADSSKTTAGVISHGIHVQWFKDKVAFDFGYLMDTPENIEAAKASQYFAIGSMAAWAVLPY